MLKFSDLLGGATAAQPAASAPPPQPIDAERALREELRAAGVAHPADTAEAMVAAGVTLEAGRERLATVPDLRQRAINGKSMGADIDVEAAVADAVINGTTPEALGRALLTRIAEAQTADGEISTHLPVRAAGSGHVTLDNPATFRSAAAEALHARLTGGQRPTGPAAALAGASLGALCREHLVRAHGNPVIAGSRGLSSDAAAIGAVLALGQQGRSDFVSALMGDVANRTVREAYEAADPSIMTVSREVEASDFRPMHLAGVGEYGALQRTDEHGEFRRAPVASEGGELLRVETFGTIHSLTRQALIDGALVDFTQSMTRAAVTARDFSCGKIADLLSANPVYFDGTALFDAAHGNLAATGSAISVASLSEARAAMRAQTDVSGKVKIRLSPRYLVVAPDRETEAQQVVAAITPDQPANANPFSGALEVVVEPRLPEGAWYLAATPSRAPALFHAYLSENRGPQVETRSGFEFDGVEMRVRLDFGCGVGDFRPLFMNEGN